MQVILSQYYITTFHRVQKLLESYLNVAFICRSQLHHLTRHSSEPSTSTWISQWLYLFRIHKLFALPLYYILHRSFKNRKHSSSHIPWLPKLPIPFRRRENSSENPKQKSHCPPVRKWKKPTLNEWMCTRSLIHLFIIIYNIQTEIFTISTNSLTQRHTDKYIHTNTDARTHTHSRHCQHYSNQYIMSTIYK